MLRQGPIASGGYEELENQDSGRKVKEIGFFEENYQRLLIKNILWQTMTSLLFVISQEVESRKDWYQPGKLFSISWQDKETP